MLSDRLIEKIVEKNNPSVIGLDTRFEYLPKEMQDRYLEGYGPTAACASLGILEFNRDIIDAIADIVPAVKVQIAYYEMYGYQGIETFAKTCAYAKEKNLFVIADCKRNDIGSTAEAYSAAYLGVTKIGTGCFRAYESDFLTVNPYLGTDGIAPFIKDCEEYDRGVFILVKTSNNSSGEYQDQILKDNGKELYINVAEHINGYIEKTGRYGYSNIGAVTGATYPQAAVKLRKILKNCILLVPGYGAQGAKASSIGSFFDKDRLGAVVNSSRAILLAYKKQGSPDHASAAREAALAMKKDLNDNL
jgi:orotidine-5'-phosphate decarboxylase